MLEDRVVFVNGEFIPWKHATAHIMSHSFSRGSALFEVLSIHNTSFGPAVFRLDFLEIDRCALIGRINQQDLAPAGHEILGPVFFHHRPIRAAEARAKGAPGSGRATGA